MHLEILRSQRRTDLSAEPEQSKLVCKLAKMAIMFPAWPWREDTVLPVQQSDR